MEKKNNMIYVKHDTTKINECGKEIINLAIQYETLIKEIFEKIENIDEAWRGDDAKKFVATISQEENIYLNFGEQLKKYGQTLTEISCDVTNTINRNNISN